MKQSCYVCSHPWRNLIDLEILENKPPGTIWGHLPVIPAIPLPTIPEIKTHQRKAHMRPREIILAEQDLKLRLLNDLIDGPDPVQTMQHVLAGAPPPLPPRPKPRNTKPAPRLSTKPPEAAWSPYVLRYRQTKYGWTPEAQIALRDRQGNRCWACGADNPTCFDVVADADHQEVCGYLCQRCKGVVSMVGRDPTLLARLQDYLLNPPTRRMA